MVFVETQGDIFRVYSVIRKNLLRIFTAESWNPKLKGPLDQPGLKVAQGQYLVGVNGKELTSAHNPYEFLDGTVNQQTVLHINDKPSFIDAWQITVEPTANERALRQRAWVEDNRRLVDKLSDGKLAYVWVPNTSTPGFVSFNRYFFAQQDKLGAVIDERFKRDLKYESSKYGNIDSYNYPYYDYMETDNRIFEYLYGRMDNHTNPGELSL